MSNRNKIILAVIGGAIVGGLGVLATIYPQFNMIIAAAQGLVALGVATMTGIAVTK
jgi:uncharacterized membrane protein YdbT with pleckstrin-like domain